MTGDYIGNWAFNDYLANNEEGEIVKIPTIKTKLKFPLITLDSFNENIYFDFGKRGTKLYEKRKALEREKSSKVL